MKNIHILPTDKPSRLVKIGDTFFLTSTKHIPGGTFYNIYVINDEKIKEGDWIVANQGVHKVTDIKTGKYPYGTLNYKGTKIYHHESWKKIILTTDPDLIKDGVQAVNNEFLECFAKNPMCEHVQHYTVDKSTTLNTVIKYELIIPKEELKYNMKQETLKEAATKEGLFRASQHNLNRAKAGYNAKWFKRGALFGSKWQAERMYTEEDIINALHSVELRDNKDYSKIYNGI